MRKADTLQGNRNRGAWEQMQEVTHATQGEGSEKAPERGQHLSLATGDEQDGHLQEPSKEEGVKIRGRAAMLTVCLAPARNPWRLEYQGWK